MNDRLAPHSRAVLGGGLNTELINRVGPQVVDDRVAGGAGLIVPLPAPLAVTHGVVSERDEHEDKSANQITLKKLRHRDGRVSRSTNINC